MDWKNILVRAATVFVMTFIAYIPASMVSGKIDWDVLMAALVAACAAAVSFVKNIGRQYSISKG